MKKIIIAFIFISLIHLSCSKESISIGNVKVVVHLVSNINNYNFYFKNDARVNLNDESGNVIASQFTNNYGSLLEFGSYNYGNYYVNVKGAVYSSVNGSLIIDHNIDTTVSFKLDAPTKTITFNLN